MKVFFVKNYPQQTPSPRRRVIKPWSIRSIRTKSTASGSFCVLGSYTRAICGSGASPARARIEFPKNNIIAKTIKKSPIRRDTIKKKYGIIIDKMKGEEDEFFSSLIQSPAILSRSNACNSENSLNCSGSELTSFASPSPTDASLSHCSVFSEENTSAYVDKMYSEHRDGFSLFGLSSPNLSTTQWGDEYGVDEISVASESRVHTIKTALRSPDQKTRALVSPSDSEPRRSERARSTSYQSISPFESARQERMDYEKERKKFDEETEHLRMQLAHAKEGESMLQLELTQNKEKIEELENERRDDKDTITDLKKQLSDADERVEEVEDDMDELNESIQRLEQSLDLKNQEIKRIIISLEESQRRVKRLELDLEESRQCVLKYREYHNKAMKEEEMLAAALGVDGTGSEGCIMTKDETNDSEIKTRRSAGGSGDSTSAMVNEYETQIDELNKKIQRLELDATGHGETVTKLKNKIIEVSVHCGQQKRSNMRKMEKLAEEKEDLAVKVRSLESNSCRCVDCDEQCSVESDDDIDMEDKRGERASFPTTCSVEDWAGLFPNPDVSVICFPKTSQVGESSNKSNGCKKGWSTKEQKVRKSLMFRQGRFSPSKKRASKIPMPTRRNTESSLSNVFSSRMKKLEEMVDQLKGENSGLLDERREYAKTVESLRFVLGQLEQKTKELEGRLESNGSLTCDGRLSGQQVTPSPEYESSADDENTRSGNFNTCTAPKQNPFTHKNEIAKSLQSEFEKVVSNCSLKKNEMVVSHAIRPVNFDVVENKGNDVSVNVDNDENSSVVSIKSTSSASVFSYASHKSEFDNEECSLRRRKVASLKIQKDRLEKEVRSRVLSLELEKTNVNAHKPKDGPKNKGLASPSVSGPTNHYMQGSFASKKNMRASWRGNIWRKFPNHKQQDELESTAFPTNSQTLTPLEEEGGEPSPE